MKVLFLGLPEILHPWYDDFLDALNGRYPVELYDPAKPMSKQFEGVDVVVDQGGSVGTRELIDAGLAAGVKLWQVLGTGLDHVDVAYFLDKGMPLANTPGAFSAIALAEHALFLMLWHAKNYNATQKNIRAGEFYRPMNDELAGTTLGIVGLGASGRALAERARPFDMRIIAIDAVEVPEDVLDELQVDFFGDPSQLEQVAAEADYLSLHVPLTPQTRHMTDRHIFERMKSTAVLINVARGELVNEKDLIEALRAGQIRGAGIDVFAHEPIHQGLQDIAHPLVSMDNVVATPHVAGVTRGTSRRRGEAAAENVARVAKGKPPQYQITSLQ